MKKRMIALGVVLFVVIGIRFILLGPFGSVRGEGLASPFFSQVSPSGRYLMDVRPELQGNIFKHNALFHNRFYIYEMDTGSLEKTLTYVCEFSYRTWDGVRFMWGEEDRVWVDSGDMGVLVWENQGGKWRMSVFDSVENGKRSDVFVYTNGVGENIESSVYTPNDLEAPEYIKNRRPSLFEDEMKSAKLP